MNKGKVVKTISNQYFVYSDGKIYECKARGKFRNEKISPLVGDYCLFDKDKLYIMEILPRKNSLHRPLISNVDVALILTSVKKPNFSSLLLDIFNKSLEDDGIHPLPIERIFTFYDIVKDEGSNFAGLLCHLFYIWAVYTHDVDMPRLEGTYNETIEIIKKYMIEKERSNNNI